MSECQIDVRYVGPGIENDVAIITFEGDIETLPGNQRGVIDAPSQTTIFLHCHGASFVAEKPLVWISHEGQQPPHIEVLMGGPEEVKLLVGEVKEKEVAKFVVNLDTEDGALTSKDPTIVTDPVVLPPVREG